MFIIKHKNEFTVGKFIGVILMLFMIFPIVKAQENRIIWYVFDMGYTNSSSSNLQVKSVVGQQLVGSMTSSTTELLSGFLADTLFRSFVVSVYDASQDIPQVYMLYQNYPNPFNPTTRIQYNIPEASFVTLKVYNMLGQEIVTLVEGKKEPGIYEVEFMPFADRLVLASGVYFYRLEATSVSDPGKIFTQVKNMMLVK